MSLDNIAITITGTPDQLAPITHLLNRGGHTVRLVDLPEMLLECDMTAETSIETGSGAVYVDITDPVTPTEDDLSNLVFEMTITADTTGFDAAVEAVAQQADAEPATVLAASEQVEPVTDTTVPAYATERHRPLADRIAALITANPDRTWTGGAVLEHLTDVHNGGSVNAALSNLVKDGRINRTGRGVYTAPPPADAGPELLRDTLLRILRCDPDPTKTWSIEELADYTGDSYDDIHDALVELHADELLVNDPDDTDQHQAVPA